MGAINEVFSPNKLSFSKIEEILNIFVIQNDNKSHNLNALQEIGLVKEYYYIKNEDRNVFINFSKTTKTVKHYINSSKLKDNFVKWTKFLFDIETDDIESSKRFNEKMEFLRKKKLNKAFFHNNLKKYLFKDNSFNKLITYGIPRNFRELLWCLIIGEKYASHKHFDFEKEQKEFNSYLKNVKNNSQIEKDLSRTFMNEGDRTSNNIQKLKNVLNCINQLNNGYCQGMNFIIGFLLKVTNFNEVETFYIFKNIFPEIKGYFEDGFPLLNKNISIFDDYFKELYPKLYKHFKKNEVYNELWVGKWLQSLFTLSLPFEELSYLWDILLIKGFDFIIYISLSLIRSIEKELLELNDSSDILDYLKNFLNPKEFLTMNKKLFEENENEQYIITFKEIADKACKIEKKITENNNFSSDRRKSDNNLIQYRNILKKEEKILNDIDSNHTKESDNSNNIKHSYSSKSTSSSNISVNSFNSSNLINTQNNVNKLKNNLCGQFELNKINNTTVKKSNFFSAKNFNHLNGINLNGNNSNLGQRGSMKLNYNNNAINVYNIIYPIRTQQFIYYNNMNYNPNLIDNRPKVTNFLIYYP